MKKNSRMCIHDRQLESIFEPAASSYYSTIDAFDDIPLSLSLSHTPHTHITHTTHTHHTHHTHHTLNTHHTHNTHVPHTHTTHTHTKHTHHIHTTHKHQKHTTHTHAPHTHHTHTPNTHTPHTTHTRTTYPPHTGKHKKNECTTAESEQKCINCITYNRYNKEGKINENYSALSKDCPSLQSVLKRYRDNIEY